MRQAPGHHRLHVPDVCATTSQVRILSQEKRGSFAPNVYLVLVPNFPPCWICMHWGICGPDWVDVRTHCKAWLCVWRPNDEVTTLWAWLQHVGDLVRRSSRWLHSNTHTVHAWATVQCNWGSSFLLRKTCDDLAPSALHNNVPARPATNAAAAFGRSTYAADFEAGANFDCWEGAAGRGEVRLWRGRKGPKPGLHSMWYWLQTVLAGDPRRFHSDRRNVCVLFPDSHYMPLDIHVPFMFGMGVLCGLRSDIILHDVCGMCRSRTVEGREEEPQRRRRCRHRAGDAKYSFAGTLLISVWPPNSAVRPLLQVAQQCYWTVEPPWVHSHSGRFDVHCCAWHSGRYVSCFFGHCKEGRHGESPDGDHPGKSFGLLIDLTEIRFPCSQDSHWVDLAKWDGKRVEEPLALRGQCHKQGWQRLRARPGWWRVQRFVG